MISEVTSKHKAEYVIGNNDTLQVISNYQNYDRALQAFQDMIVECPQYYHSFIPKEDGSWSIVSTLKDVGRYHRAMHRSVN